MKKYFNNTNAMNTENTRIPAVLRTADSEPHRFIRIKMDKDANMNGPRGEILEITAPGAKVRTFVIPTNEEYMIALDTLALVK